MTVGHEKWRDAFNTLRSFERKRFLTLIFSSIDLGICSLTRRRTSFPFVFLTMIFCSRSVEEADLARPIWKSILPRVSKFQTNTDMQKNQSNIDILISVIAIIEIIKIPYRIWAPACTRRSVRDRAQDRRRISRPAGWLARGEWRIADQISIENEKK